MTKMASEVGFYPPNTKKLSKNKQCTVIACFYFATEDALRILNIHNCGFPCFPLDCDSTEEHVEATRTLHRTRYFDVKFRVKKNGRCLITKIAGINIEDKNIIL